MEARNEFDEFIFDVDAAIGGPRERALERVLDLVRRRDAQMRDRLRAAIRAERDYQEAVHRRVGSRYGAERRDRELEAARARRDRTAKEVGL